MNPNDTEEAIWAFLAEAQLIGHEKARQEILKACDCKHLSDTCTPI